MEAPFGRPAPGGPQGMACGSCSARVSSRGAAVGPPLPPPQYALRAAGGLELFSQQQQEGQDSSDDTDCLPPVRLLDATECFWNAFLRLGNLAIINCITVVSSHPIELDSLREAATIVARRHQALRLVIRLTDANAVAQHQAQQYHQQLLQAQQQQPVLQETSSDDLLREEFIGSSGEGGPLRSTQSFYTAASLRSNSSSSCQSSSSYSSRRRLGWGWPSRRSASQFDKGNTYNEPSGSKLRSSSCSSSRETGSEAEAKATTPMGFPLPCKCRRRADLKFTFHERLGEPIIDVEEATVKDAFSSSGLRWHQQQNQERQLDLGLLEEYPWMKAMAWEQKIPFDCEEGPLWRLRMLPSQEETLAPQDVQPFLPTATQVGRSLERTHTSSFDLQNVLQAPPNRSNSNDSSSGGTRRFRTHLIGVFHHSTIDGLSRKDFWDEVLRCLLTLNNAKRYAEYASSIKALAAPTRATTQPSSQQQQETADGQGPSEQPGVNQQQSLSVFSTATPTPLPSPMHRWRRGSSNTSSSTSSSSICFRRGSAGSTSSSWLPLGELDQSRVPLDSPSAHSWCYLRRLSAVSAGSLDSAAGYPGDQNLKQKQHQGDLLFPPKTVLPPGLNDIFRLTRCISVLRPLMAPGGGFHVRMYVLERQLLRTLRNPFASYFPSKRFRASGSEYAIYRTDSANAAAAAPSVAGKPLRGHNTTASCQGNRQRLMSPSRAPPEECDSIDYSSFTGVVTLRLSETLTAGLLAACRERKMTLNGLITTAAAVALSRMLWRRQRVMQQHSLLADLSCVSAAATSAQEWPQQHHHRSLWDFMKSPKEEQEQEGSLVPQQDDAAPQQVTHGDDGEPEGLPPLLASSRAAAAQAGAAATIERAQTSANWGALFSGSSSKGASKGSQQTLNLSPHITCPRLSSGGGMQRLPSIQDLLRMPQPDYSSSSKRGTKDALPRSAVSRSNASGLTSGWSLSHIPEMLQQLTLWSPVSGEGTPGKANRQFGRHKGPVYIYTLQAISGRRWLESWLQEQEGQPEAHARGRKKLPRDDRIFEEFLLQHFTCSLKSHKCSRYVAAVAAAPVATAASANPSKAGSQVESPRHPASLPSGSGSNSSSRSLTGGSINTRSVSSGHPQQRSPNEVDAARPQATEAFFSNTGDQQQRRGPTCAAGATAAVAAVGLRHSYRKPRTHDIPAKSPAVSFTSSRCITTPGGLIETTGHSSASTTSSLHCRGASTISADSLEEDTEKAIRAQPTKSKSSASCSRRLQAHTRTISSRISRGLRLLTQWIWGSSSTSNTKRESQKQQLKQQQPPFGLGSFALLMPLRLRVPVECDEGADAVWALGKACTDSVQEFVSLANPSFGTLNFQLISSFVEEMRGELKVLRVFKEDAFARPSVFLISNGGTWGGAPVKQFAAEIHAQLRAATERHRRLLQRMLQHQSLLQHRGIKKQMLHQLPAQVQGGAGAADAAIKNKRQCSGRRATRNAKSYARPDNQPPTSPTAAAAAHRNSNIRGAAVDVVVPPGGACSREQQQQLQQQQLGSEGVGTPEGPLGDCERMLPPLEPFDVSVDSSWSIVTQHDTGLNYFAHNCVTIGGRMNWSLQYHSNLTSREIAALYGSYILAVLEEAHEQHVQRKMQQHQQQLQQQPPPLSASAGIGGTMPTPLETMRE